MKMIGKGNSRGVAFFITLALLLILSMAALVFLLTAYNSANINEALYRRERALVMAEAGLHYALYQLRNDITYTGETFLAGSGVMLDLMPDMPAGTGWSLIITITPSGAGDPGDYVVKSKVDYPKATVF
ncbi:MAG: hypothetical protein KJ706_02105 [Candidatus Omnitrophica bacterium]|nr:hypothetical protein [Candidatus Omnitrophota bacterium]